MRKYILGGLFALSACATVGNPSTPAQKLYATVGAYDAALAGANAYAAQPGADPAVVHRLNVTNQSTLPAVKFARAYPACKSGATEFQGTPCLSFDFSTQGILANTIVLQSAIVALQQRN